MGAIPKWGWILFLIVAIDDILLWFSSPAWPFLLLSFLLFLEEFSSLEGLDLQALWSITQEELLPIHLARSLLKLQQE